MANTISIQDVLAVYRRFATEVTLEVPKDVNFGPWVLSLKIEDKNYPDGDVNGTISYSESLLAGDDRGEIIVSLSIGQSATFRKTYSAKLKNGWGKSRYIIPPEMRDILDFVRETDKPKREDLRERNRRIDQSELDKRQLDKSDAEAKAAETVRNRMR